MVSFLYVDSEDSDQTGPISRLMLNLKLKQSPYCWIFHPLAHMCSKVLGANCPIFGWTCYLHTYFISAIRKFYQ